jgi:hypothetical protein
MCIYDDMKNPTTLQNVKENCQYIKDQGFYGYFHWSLQRDMGNTLGASAVVNMMSSVFGSTPLPNPYPTPIPTQINLNF